MNVFLWILQLVCAFLFMRYGVRKLFTPKARLKYRIAWVEEAPSSFVRLIGLLEVAGGLGLILPGLTGIAPILTPVAAAGLAALMILGAALHASRGEYRELLRHEPWFFIAFVVIAWARFGPYPH